MEAPTFDDTTQGRPAVRLVTRDFMAREPSTIVHALLELSRDARGAPTLLELSIDTAAVTDVAYWSACTGAQVLSCRLEPDRAVIRLGLQLAQPRTPRRVPGPTVGILVRTADRDAFHGALLLAVAACDGTGPCDLFLVDDAVIQLQESLVADVKVRAAARAAASVRVSLIASGQACLDAQVHRPRASGLGGIEVVWDDLEVRWAAREFSLAM